MIDIINHYEMVHDHLNQMKVNYVFDYVEIYFHQEENLFLFDVNQLMKFHD